MTVTKRVTHLATGQSIDMPEDEEDCMYCAAACDHVAFNDVGDSAFLEIDGHVHQVYYCGVTNEGQSIFSCKCVSREFAERAILHVRNKTN